MATLARPFRPWEILFARYLGLRPPAADCDLGCLGFSIQCWEWVEITISIYGV